MVPAARQSAVSMPMSPKVIRIFLTFLTPEPDIRSSSAALCPLTSPYPKKIRYPAISAYTIEIPESRHTKRPIIKAASETVSNMFSFLHRSGTA